MRALVVANPRATAMTDLDRGVLTSALGQVVDTEVELTSDRGHAAALACRAMRDHYDLVVAIGGDGTVNEVINGLLTDGVHAAVPALGVIPTGSTNVFARALEIPNDPLRATAGLIDSLRTGRRRSIGLGRADDRWFCFAAGLGYDAAVIASVERLRRRGVRSTHSLYSRVALREFYRLDRRHPALSVELPTGEVVDGVFFAIITNVTPWTYVGPVPLHPTPNASFDTGLDIYARRRMGSIGFLYGMAQVARKNPRISSRAAVSLHDLPSFVLRSDRPLPFQVDGDHLGERDVVHFTAASAAVAVCV